MKFALSALLAALALSQSIAAEPAVQAPIPAECRCVNETGVQCAFASLRTLALRAKLPRLAELARRCPGPLHSVREIQSLCQQAGCECECVPPGDHARLFAFLTRHVTEGHRPCAIGVQNGAHVLCVCHFEQGKKVVCLGNSPTAGGIREFGWNEFLSQMQPDGMAYALPCDGGKCTPCVETKEASARPPKPEGDGWVYGPVPGYGDCWSRVISGPATCQPNCPNGQCPNACPTCPMCPNGRCPVR